MNKSNSYTDFAVIEAHIRRARIERSVVLSQLVVRGIEALGRGLVAAKRSLEANFQAVMHRTISSKPGAGRYIPRYD